MQKAKAVSVPLDADRVISPIVRYGRPLTAIFFPIKNAMPDAAPSWGRVTFEGFDSIRCCRGENTPYEVDDYRAWAYEVSDSQWLNERHAYEMEYYETPLLEEYHHYVFAFHDEFVEAIAKGIWVESTGFAISDEMTPYHPLKPLPINLPAESKVLHGISFEIRTNPLPIQELVERSKLCSQKLFQFYLMLDGKRSESYWAELRTIEGRSTTKMWDGWSFTKGVTIKGIAKIEDLMSEWEKHVYEVAEQRKEMEEAD